MADWERNKTCDMQSGSWNHRWLLEEPTEFCLS